MYDLIIIGAGTAGLTAAIYAARAGLHFLVLEQDGWGGGQISSAARVDNFPGNYHITGEELGEKFREQAESLGAEIVPANVLEVRSLSAGPSIASRLEIRADSDTVGDQGVLDSRTVIAASGAVPRKLGIPGEAEFLGQGVSYCAACDGAFFEGQDAAVIGGGDTAVEDALFLSGICRSVTLVHRREEFRASEVRVQALRSTANIHMLTSEEAAEIAGGTNVERLILKSGKVLPVSAVFSAVGIIPVTGYLKKLPLTFADGYVEAPENGSTEVPGLYVAGDIRKKRLRQLVTAAADGANAATAAADWLKNTEHV